MSQLLLDISPEWQPSLDNFVVGRNGELLSVLHHSLGGGTSERCFYLWGESGSGKSHILQACVRAAQDIHETQDMHETQDVNAGHMQHGAIYVRGSVPPQSMGSGATVVAVDDVETLDDAEQIGLFDLYNQMRDSGGMLLVSGKASPLHLTLRDDLRTRLGWGLVYQVHGLSDEEKSQALTQHAQSRGFALSVEVRQYLLRHGRRDLPSLIAALDALDEHSLRLHRAPSVPLLKEILQKNRC